MDLKQKEKDVNNKLQLYGIVEGMSDTSNWRDNAVRVARHCQQPLINNDSLLQWQGALQQPN